MAKERATTGTADQAAAAAPLYAPATGWSTTDAAVKLVPTHCAFCGMQCGMNLKVDAAGHVFGVEPRDFPVNKGRLCPKGVVAYQQIGHPQRLTYPMMRRGGKGSPLERCTWDEALDRIVQTFRGIQARHGGNAVAVYSGSSMTTEKSYLMGKFARVALGTGNLDYNGRLCMVSAASANNKAFGVDRAANPWSDIALADVVLSAGSNTAECHPLTMPYLWEARDRGGKHIVVDPRVTPGARTADVHLQIRPGTDTALANAILYEMIRHDWLDHNFIATRTVDWAETAHRIAGYSPARVASLCGIPAARIEEAAELWGTAKTSFLLHARGIEHSTHGTNNVLAYINLVLASGRIGRLGCGYGTLTGQGNGQGGREHGQKVDQLPGQRKYDDPAARAYIASVWGIPESAFPPMGYAITDMIEPMIRGEIRGMLNICSNPMVSLPDQAAIRQALETLECYVVIDFFLSESAELADIVLPGSAWAEDEGSTTNVEGRVLRINKAADPPGEARVDWAIICDLARRLGHGDKFAYESAGEIWDELRVASKGGKADYYGITYEKINAQDGVFWPCPTLDHPGTPRLFEERFYHPDGKARFHPLDYQPSAELPDADYPFFYTTGRVIFHYLSGNQTRRIGALVENAPEPYVEIHPLAAEKLGVDSGDLLRLRSRRGELILPAKVTRSIRPDTVFVPYHWGGKQAANLLTIRAYDPTSRIPEYKVCAVALERAPDAAAPSPEAQRAMPPAVPLPGEQFA
ncbi:MAG: molybdopterin oxidoreductase family protein [Chloroflexota bacterium]|nr:molybdopterin oxidoreductase family protein [Chloroflexota bacterium]